MAQTIEKQGRTKDAKLELYFRGKDFTNGAEIRNIPDEEFNDHLAASGADRAPKIKRPNSHHRTIDEIREDLAKRFDLP